MLEWHYTEIQIASLSTPVRVVGRNTVNGKVVLSDLSIAAVLAKIATVSAGSGLKHVSPYPCSYQMI